MSKGRIAVAVAVAALVVCSLVPSLARADEPSAPPRPPKHCIGWAIAGALGGAAVGFYGATGIAAASGVDVLRSEKAFAVAVGAEFVGFIAGPIASCRLSDDPRIVPAATFVIAGGSAGGAATGLGGYAFLRTAHPFGDEGDNPIGSGLTLLFAVSAGALGGGYLGWLLSEEREPASRWSSGLTLSPVATRDTAGLLLGSAF